MADLQLVKKVQTKPTKAQWLSAVTAAWAIVVGGRPYNMQLGVLYGMFGQETGYGESCWNGNVGNIRAMAGYTGLAIDLPGAWEINAKGDRVIQGGAFRAYTSIQAGYVGLLSFLKANEPDAWAELMKSAPNGASFVYGLKRDRYFTGDVETYAHNVASIALSFPRIFVFELSSPIPSVDPVTAPQTPLSRASSSSQRLPVVVPPPSPDDSSESIAEQACVEPDPKA